MPSPGTQIVSRTWRTLVAAAALGLVACGSDPANVAQTAVFTPTTILDAVLVGDREAVERFIAAGANVNGAETDGTSLLMRAIHGHFPEIAKLLIDAGANVSAKNRYGVNPLYLAARGKDAATARDLLAAGADANSALPEGETVLMTAARAGDADTASALLAGRSRSGLATIATNNDSGIATSSGYGAIAAVTAARANAADPNARESRYGQTALMWAAADGHADVVRLLIAAGAVVDEPSRVVDAPDSSYERLEGDFVYPKTPKGGLTALHFAAREGTLDALRVLIESGASLDTTDAENTTPLLYASLGGHFDVAAALLEAGADPKIADAYGRTVLFAAADLHNLAVDEPAADLPVASAVAALDILELAIAKGADPNAALADAPPDDPDRPGEPNPILDKGATPFFRAAMSGDLDVMERLLAAGANPLVVTDAREPTKIGGSERPSNGRTTALMAAAGVGWRGTISRGREANALKALELLVERGGDVNAANQMGDTALHGATLRGSTAIIQFLVERGANVHAKNAKGQTPLDIATGVPGERIPYNEATAALLRRLSQRG